MARNAKTPAPQRTPVHIGGSGSSFLLFSLGFGLIAAGAGLVAADHVSWQLVKVRQTLAPYGIGGVGMVQTGLVVFSMGFVAKAVVRACTSLAGALPQHEDNTQLNAVAGQLAVDLGNVQRAVARVGEVLNNVVNAQNQLAKQVAHNAQASAGSNQDDGMYRLAASMDKLGGQVDESLQGLDNKLRMRIESVTNALNEARNMMQQSTPQQPAAAAFIEEPPPPVPSGLAYVGEQQGKSQQELDVLVELERELLEGEAPNLEFFDAVEDADPAGVPEYGGPAQDPNANEPAPRTPLDLRLEGEG